MCDISIIDSAIMSAANVKVECESITTQQAATAKKTTEYIAGGDTVNRVGTSFPAVSLKNLSKSEANYDRIKRKCGKCSKCSKCKW